MTDATAFVRSSWYVAASLDEVSGKLLARTILNEPIVIFRTLNGDIGALEDRCCHRGAPLSLGEAVGDGIRCGYHGMEFGTSGICSFVPGQPNIPSRARVRSYPVAVKGDYVWIWMGDPATADPCSIIDYPVDDKVNWPRIHDMLHLKASYVMVLENLMDLSHLSYLHKNSIGSSSEDSANANMDVSRTPDGMRFLRIMRDADAPATWQKRYKIGAKVDRWSDFEYVAPCFIKQYSGGVRAGEYDQGVRDGGHQVRTLHAITPETETSCFYFFNKADGYAKYEPADLVRTWASTTDVFKEDAFMLEQQQLRLKGYDTSKLVNIKSDVARVQMIRALQERIRREQEQLASGQ